MGTKEHTKTYVYNPNVPERGTRPTHKQYHEPSTHAELMDHLHADVIFLLRRISGADSLFTLEGLSAEKSALIVKGESLLYKAQTQSSRYNPTFRTYRERLENSLTELSHQYRRKGIQLLEERRRLLAAPHPAKKGNSFAQRLAKKIISECRLLNKEGNTEDYIPHTVSHASRSQARFEAKEPTISLEALCEECLIEEGKE